MTNSLTNISMPAAVTLPCRVSEREHRKSQQLPPLAAQRDQVRPTRQPLSFEERWFGTLILAIIVISGISLLSLVLSLLASAIRSFSEVY